MLSVYGIFNDETNQLVYVGISSNLKKRLEKHLYGLAKDFKNKCRMEVLESAEDTTKETEAFWIEYCCALGCSLYNKKDNPHYRNKHTSHSIKPFGIKLPLPLYEYYASTAKSMGITLGERIRNVLALYTDNKEGLVGK